MIEPADHHPDSQPQRVQHGWQAPRWKQRLWNRCGGKSWHQPGLGSGDTGTLCRRPNTCSEHVFRPSERPGGLGPGSQPGALLQADQPGAPMIATIAIDVVYNCDMDYGGCARSATKEMEATLSSLPTCHLFGRALRADPPRVATPPSSTPRADEHAQSPGASSHCRHWRCCCSPLPQH